MDFSWVLHINLPPTHSYAVGVFSHALCMGRKPPVFIKICLIHICRHYLQLHKEVHYSDNLYSLCSECTQTNHAHCKMSLTSSKIFVWLRWEEFTFFCKKIQIIVLVMKYPYIYNKLILWRNTSASLPFQPRSCLLFH